MSDFLSQDQLKMIEDLATNATMPDYGSIARADIRCSMYTEDGKLTEMLDQPTSGFLVNAKSVVKALLKDIAKYQDALQDSTPADREPTLEEETLRKLDELTICFKGNTQNIIDLTKRVQFIEEKIAYFSSSREDIDGMAIVN